MSAAATLGNLTYVLPLRRGRLQRDHELEEYLRRLAEQVDVVVVDGSEPDIFAAHHSWFDPSIRHVPVDPDLLGRYGKVNGVVTGVRSARHERVVIAGDDVRYGKDQLVHMAELLAGADLVRPQNLLLTCPLARPLGHGPDTAEPSLRARLPGHARGAANAVPDRRRLRR